MRVDIFHNILWSKYKGAIFSALYKEAQHSTLEIAFFQIAATERDRIGLADPDTSYHDYPFRLLYNEPYEAVSSFSKSIKLARLVLASDADLIVLPGYHLVEHWVMLLMAKLRGKRVGVFCDSTANEGRKSSWRQSAKRFFFRHCDGYFAYGLRSSDYLKANGAKPEMIFWGCLAAAMPASYQAAAVPDQRQTCHDGLPRRRLLYVGRLAAEKALDQLIEGFANVRASLPNHELRLVGSGPQRAALEAQAARLGVTDQVVFCGSMDAEVLSREYLSADFLVLPSLREPWGLVVNEALSYGCPVVVSDACGCLPELVVEGRSGYSFHAGSLPELQACLAKATSASAADWTTNCLQIIEEFSPRLAAQRIHRGLGSILAGGASR